MSGSRRAHVLPGLGVLAALTFLPHDSSAQRAAPGRPPEPFSVLVHTSVEEPEEPDEPYPMSKVTEQIAERIEDRKKWFVLTERADGAEILVDVVNHAHDEQVHTRLETRVDVTGTRKEWVDVSWVQEQHFLEARVEFPDGAQAIVKGSDTRTRGGSLKHAAEELAKNLELLCRERYWDIVSATGRSR